MKSRKFSTITLFLLGAATLATGALGVACSNDDTPHEVIVVDSGTGTKDSGGTSTVDSSAGGDSGGGGTDAAEPECFTNPQNHHQLLNACTDAARVDKTVTLPNLLPDGGLPPLP
jgi:hypothetical protein